MSLRIVAIAVKICRIEIQEWFQAGLIRIPGLIGCWFRAKLYGYSSGQRTHVWDDVIIYHPRKLRLGTNVQIVRGCQINAGGEIEIGDNVLIGPGVFIWSQNHTFSRTDIPVCDQGYDFLPVKIEEDVWIGARAIILPGVCIRRGCVIAAGSVVTHSTEPNTLYAGVPARAIKKRLDDLASNRDASEKVHEAHARA